MTSSQLSNDVCFMKQNFFSWSKITALKLDKLIKHWYMKTPVKFDILWYGLGTGSAHFSSKTNQISCVTVLVIGQPDICILTQV